MAKTKVSRKSININPSLHDLNMRARAIDAELKEASDAAAEAAAEAVRDSLDGKIMKAKGKRAQKPITG